MALVLFYYVTVSALAFQDDLVAACKTPKNGKDKAAEARGCPLLGPPEQASVFNEHSRALISGNAPEGNQ
jgi:hypothetical protein